MLSTLLLLAASNSSTSMVVSLMMARQASHWPQGSPWLGLRQLMARLMSFAMVVLPVPRHPQNR